MLDEKERNSLERERCEARTRMIECSAHLRILRQWLATFERDFYHWEKRYQKADRLLAEERVQKIPTGKSGKVTTAPVKFTTEQLYQIAQQLGTNLDEVEDEEPEVDLIEDEPFNESEEEDA